MKKSIIFKAISFLCIPICIIAVILSIFAVYVKNGTDFNESKYYASSPFVTLYIDDLSNVCDDLIYNNENYYNIKDGKNTIYYTNRQLYNSNVKDFKYLVIYKNKAITNIEISKELNTIDSIKEYIQNLQGYENVNLQNGLVNSTNDSIKRMSTGCLSTFTKTYYMIEDNEKNYYKTSCTDFEIYSSYKAEFKQNSKEIAISNMLKKVPLINDGCYIIIPMGSIIAMLMVIYLAVSIGEDKKLNYFDKIPLEIVGFVAIIISVIPFIFLSDYFYSTGNDYVGGISIIITVALFIYVIACVCMITFIRRLKAKSFWKTTIIGKIFYWFKDVLLKNISYSIGTTAKVILVFLLIGFITFLIMLIFRGALSVILIIALYGYIMYRTIIFFKECSKIEKKIEEVRDGNNQLPLDVNEFSSEFQNVATSINNISEGIETAVQERMKSERLKAELITNVSHDIKTPLTSIINYSDLLKNEKIDNEKANEYIEIIYSKSQRLKRLTEDLIEASKIQTGNVSLKKEKINVVELIRQAVGEFEDKFSKKGLNTIIDCKQNEIFIFADSRYMYRIIENLFSNISKYALENSRVYIDIDIYGDDVNIAIKNISKDKLNISADELMQRFVRGESSRTTEGSGLGISIAQNLTTLQDGKFDLVLDGDLFKVRMSFKII
jgi:signal transduction histidine kinase